MSIRKQNMGGNCCKIRGNTMTVCLTGVKSNDFVVRQFDTVSELLEVCGKWLDIDPNFLEFIYDGGMGVEPHSTLDSIGIYEGTPFSVRDKSPSVVAPRVFARERFTFDKDETRGEHHIRSSPDIL
jgi:hypothetical protein